MKLSVKLELERGDDVVEVQVEGKFVNSLEDNPHESGWSLDEMEISPKNIDLTESEFELAAEKLYLELEQE